MMPGMHEYVCVHVYVYVYVCICDRACKNRPSECKQVDILISKNQALQMLYLKHIMYIKLHILSWKKTNKIHENLIPMK